MNRSKHNIIVKTAPLFMYYKLVQEGYSCYNVAGVIQGVPKGLQDSVPRITNVNAYRQRHNLKGKDYIACTYGYSEGLEQNKKNIFNTIKNLFRASGKIPTKIAFLGIDHTKHDGFSFRHTFSHFFCLN